MNGFDYIALVVLVMAVLRGRRNGLAVEFYRLFRMTIALLAGTSLYGMLSGLITNIMNIKSGIADPLMFIVVSVGAWRLLQRLRRWMEAMILAKLPRNYQAIGGAIAAGLKAAILIGGIVALFAMAPRMPGHDAVSRNSFASKIMRPLISAD